MILREQKPWNDLYWTTGDGGLQKDPYNNSQKVKGFLGAVVRISVPSYPDDKTVLYKTPVGNYQDRGTDCCRGRPSSSVKLKLDS